MIIFVVMNKFRQTSKCFRVNLLIFLLSFLEILETSPAFWRFRTPDHRLKSLPFVDFESQKFQGATIDFLIRYCNFLSIEEVSVHNLKRTSNHHKALLPLHLKNRLKKPIFPSKDIQCMGARRGGGGGKLPPPETEKIVVEKWCYFPELCKMTEVREEWIENGSKVNFPLRFWCYGVIFPSCVK